MNALQIPCKTGEVSDGHHTFDELYEHRCTLFLALMQAHPDISWFSRKHHDYSEWPGWFIAGMDTPHGAVTYHLPDRLWSLAKETGAFKLDVGLSWDGHTPADVVNRIQAWVATSNTSPRIQGSESVPTVTPITPGSG